jgi:hypothetical protein
MKRSYQREAYDRKGGKPYSRSLLAYATIATGNDDDLPRLIGDLLYRPGWLGGTSWLRIPMRLSDMAHTSSQLMAGAQSSG